MKKLISMILAVAVLASCNNKKKDEGKEDGSKPATKMDNNINYPYKAEYSNFQMGDPQNAKLVLDFIKNWEENKMDDMRDKLADSVSVNFQDGNLFNGPKDSLIKYGKMARANFTDVKIRMDAFMPVHSNDKNEDYVLVWETDFNTAKDGKMDSVINHAYFLVKDNKIAHWSEYDQKNPTAGDMKK